MELAKQVLEFQRNDKRSEAEKIEAGVAFVMGPDYIPSVLALRAELAQAKEEIATRDRMMDAMANKIVAEQTSKERAEARVKELEGAMSASDERVRIAGERAGIAIGCDTPEWMADRIEDLERWPIWAYEDWREDEARSLGATFRKMWEEGRAILARKAGGGE